MSLKVLHTSDWHLGHTFYDFDRTYEHEKFLEWLLLEIVKNDIDLLLISGDIFDVANPSAASQKMLYGFLKNAHHHNSNLQIIIIAGNHDSAARIEAPRPLLEEFNTTVIGQLNRNEDRSINLENLIISVKDKTGNCVAWCMAVPFLRLGDYPVVAESKNPYNDGVSALYRMTFERVQTKCSPDQAIIAMGHLHAAGTQVSDDSERNIIIGGIDAISTETFNEKITYTALGHLHKPQMVSGRTNIRYAGSPLPMSFSEIDYKHQVVILEIDKSEIVSLESLLIPRFVDLIKIPKKHELLEEVLKQLRLIGEMSLDFDEQPYLEVLVLRDGPEPSLKFKVDEILKNKPVRFARLDVKSPVSSNSESNVAMTFDDLQKLEPADIFLKAYRRQYNSEPNKEVMTLFNEVLKEINFKEE